MAEAKSRLLDRPRAGLVPYVFDNEKGCFKFLVMVSSDARFGGPHPMISKGYIEANESLVEAALREAIEELGLKESNMTEIPWPCWTGRFVGMTAEYDIDVVAVAVHDPKDFDVPHFETKYTIWMTADSFKLKGRKDHREIIERLQEMLLTKAELST